MAVNATGDSAPASTLGSLQASVLPPPLRLEGESSRASTWRNWKQLWDAFSVLTDLKSKSNEYQASMLITCLGSEGLAIMNALPYATEADRKDATKILDLMEKHFLETENTMFERHKFYERRQSMGEQVDNYIAELRRLARTCNFVEDGKDFTNQMIRDRLICGISNGSIRRKLLAKNMPSLEVCVKECRSAEATSEQAEYMGTPAAGQPSIAVKEEVCQLTRRRSDNSNGPHLVSIAQCNYCGRSHAVPRSRYCPAFGKSCNYCGKENHFRVMCRARQNNKPELQRDSKRLRHSSVHFMDGGTDTMPLAVEHDRAEVLTVSEFNEYVYGTQESCSQRPRNKLFTTMRIVDGGGSIRFQIDTGATCCVIRQQDLPPGVEIRPGGKTRLSFYNGSSADSLGTCQLCLEPSSSNEQHVQEFQVVTDGIAPLLGAEAAQRMRLITVNPDEVSMVRELQHKAVPDFGGVSRSEFLSKYPEVFQPAVGCLKGPLHLDVDPQISPTHMPTRRIPITVKEPLKKELARLESLDVIQKVNEPSDWTSALVVAHKPNGSLRVCIDPQGLNKALKRDSHPVPTIDELLPELKSAKVFSKCDVRNGFWHVQLDSKSSHMTTFSTPFGRYRWKRMPFGIKPASEIFQRRLEQELEGLSGVRNIHDDILVYGEGPTLGAAVNNHDQRMHALLQRCRDSGIVLNSGEKKFILKEPELPYLGHVFTSDGLCPDKGKVKALTEMPQPENSAAIRRFLGMVNYLARFIPHLSDLCEPLRKAMNNECWQWTEECTEAFRKTKEEIANATVLRYFNPQEQAVIQCDASSTGLGAVLLQQGQPVVFASRALSRAETNYCQLEKEMLAIVFSLRRFDQYVYGQHVTVESDHQPLEIILKKPLKDVPRRLQRMILELQRYTITVQYRKGSDLFLPDTLSRAYLPSTDCDYDTDERVCMFFSQRELEDIRLISDETAISDERLTEIADHTNQDSLLQNLKKVIQNGWPNCKSKVSVELHPYFHIRDELAVENGIIVRGTRCLIPATLRRTILNRIHSAHMGIVGSVRRARLSVYWPGMTTDIENFVRSCRVCNEQRSTVQCKEPLQSHERLPRPWAKVATDLFSLDGRNFLVTVDYWSNYFELDELRQTDAGQVVRCLRRHFATHGIPDIVVSDNGPQFASDVFRQFAKKWMFKHVTTSPYHPQANGMAESAVKVAKVLLRTALASGEDPWLSILTYRNTPTPGMNTSPAQRLMSRPTKTLLPVLPGEFNQNRSTQQDCVSREQRLIRQQQHYNKTARCLPPLEVGCHVFVRPTRLGCHQWKEGIIRNGPDHYRSYSVQLTSGQVLRRNRRDLRLSRTAPSDPEKELMADEWEQASVGEPDPVETKAVSTPESNRPVGDYITRYGRTSNVTNLYGNPVRY